MPSIAVPKGMRRSPWEGLLSGLGGGLQQGVPFGINRALTLADEQRQRQQRMEDAQRQMEAQEAMSMRGLAAKGMLEDVLTRDAPQEEMFAGIQHAVTSEQERMRREAVLNEALGSMAEEAGSVVGPTGPQPGFYASGATPTSLDPEQRNTMMAMQLRGRQKKQKAGGASDPESFRLQLKDAISAMGKINPITGAIAPIRMDELPTLKKLLLGYRNGAALEPSQIDAVDSLVKTRGGE